MYHVYGQPDASRQGKKMLNPSRDTNFEGISAPFRRGGGGGGACCDVLRMFCIPGYVLPDIIYCTWYILYMCCVIVREGRELEKKCKYTSYSKGRYDRRSFCHKFPYFYFFQNDIGKMAGWWHLKNNRAGFGRFPGKTRLQRLKHPFPEVKTSMP